MKTELPEKSKEQLGRFYTSHCLSLISVDIGVLCDEEVKILQEMLRKDLSEDDITKLVVERTEQYASDLYERSVELFNPGVVLLTYSPISKLKLAQQVHEAYFGRMKE